MTNEKYLPEDLGMKRGFTLTLGFEAMWIRGSPAGVE